MNNDECGTSYQSENRDPFYLGYSIINSNGILQPTVPIIQQTMRNQSIEKTKKMLSTGQNQQGVMENFDLFSFSSNNIMNMSCNITSIIVLFILFGFLYYLSSY
jgi:hypothetical protein